jgi:zinc protease
VIVPRIEALGAAPAGQEPDALVLAEGPSFDVVHVRIVFDAGAMGDGARSGLTHLAFGMLDRGTRRRDRAAFNAALEDAGAMFGWTVGRTSTTLSVRVLREGLGPALALVQECLLEAADDAEEFAELRDEVREDVAITLQDPAGVASRLLGRALWGTTGAGAPVDGTVAGRARARAGSLERRRLEVLGARVMAGVGSDAPERDSIGVRALIEAVRAAVPRRTQPEPAVPPPVGAGLFVAPFADVEQGTVYRAAPAPAPREAGWLAAWVQHAAFTASFTSPLMRAVRGDEGLAYDVHSELLAEPVALHLLSAQPQAAGMSYLLRKVDEAWARFVERPLDAGALEELQRHLRGRHLVSLETVRQRLSTAMSYARTGVDLAWMARLPDAIAELGPEAVHAAAASWGWGLDGTVLAVGGAGAADAQWSGQDARPLDVGEVR